MRSLALILSMTAPVPPAHLSFMEGIFFLRPVSGSFLKMMILASWPPNSITEPHSGYSFSTASETAFTSWTNFAPRYFDMPLPPEPVMRMRDWSALNPSISVSKRFDTEIEGFKADQSRILITGSGGNGMSKYLGAKFVQEVNAVSLAVEKLYPECGSVIELGGQDAKRSGEDTSE